MTDGIEPDSKMNEESGFVSLLESNNNKTQKRSNAQVRKEVPLRVSREEVPSVMREPGILTGYRPINQPWSYYIKSLFWIHNETGNIWTHLTAPYIVIVLVYIIGKDINFFKDKSSHGILMFTVASFFVFMCSASAHLLCNKSVLWFNTMFALDYVGIAVYIYGQGMLLYYCSGNALFYTKMGSFYPLVHAILCINITFGMTLSIKYRHRLVICKLLKMVPCAVALGFCQIILLLRLYTCFRENNCFDNPNHFQIYPACMALINALTFSLHLPERAYPGKFDIWGHGHQWFHIGCMIAPLSKIYACYIDLLRLPRDVLEMAQPDVPRIWASFLTVIGVNLFIIVMYYVFFIKKLLKVEKLKGVKLAFRHSKKEVQTFV